MASVLRTDWQSAFICQFLYPTRKPDTKGQTVLADAHTVDRLDTMLLQSNGKKSPLAVFWK